MASCHYIPFQFSVSLHFTIREGRWGKKCKYPDCRGHLRWLLILMDTNKLVFFCLYTYKQLAMMLVHMLIKSAAASSRAHKTHLHAWFTVAWIGISVRHGCVHADELMSRCSRVIECRRWKQQRQRTLSGTWLHGEAAALSLLRNSVSDRY